MGVPLAVEPSRSPCDRLVRAIMGIFSLPACDWCLLRVCSLSPPHAACDGPHSKTFWLPVAFGGLNNVKAFVYGAVKLSVETGRTMLLPLVRERPHLMHGHRHPETMGLIR
eukprot:2206065-Pyramimonas_sp.AAC.1